ncbi:hypothetical protein KDA_45800 [Dictyobacter alpinus]|uniref:Major facilitator superfamily (MFS) profile domain-containing protein n=1 Tax=Dictyobacter alpinus TaxID=2014873 RepID=A0A402BCN3_9CHLR|nr:hypothetical protein KDA_45800 [Dictyobacter alpinus]
MQLGLIFFAWGVLVGLSSVFLVEFMRKRIAPVPLILGNSVLLVIDFLLIAFIYNAPVATVLIIISGILCGLNNALFTSLAIEVSPFTRSISSGAYNFLRWAGAAFAPWLAGLLTKNVGPSMPYVLGAIVLVCGLILLQVRKHHIENGLADKGEGVHGELLPILEPEELPV